MPHLAPQKSLFLLRHKFRLKVKILLKLSVNLSMVLFNNTTLAKENKYADLCRSRDHVGYTSINRKEVARERPYRAGPGMDWEVHLITPGLSLPKMWL